MTHSYYIGSLSIMGTRWPLKARGGGNRDGMVSADPPHFSVLSVNGAPMESQIKRRISMEIEPNGK